MKKNRMMRLASILLVCVLLTTSVISGTFAKYTTSDTATDSARVAKWGVEVAATGNDAFGLKYDDEIEDDGVKVVSNVNVVAPGTNGDLGSITITGQPEVMVKVVVTADLELNGWKFVADWDNNPNTADEEKEYCPIVFTIAGQTYGTIDGVNNQSTDVNDLIADIEAVLNKTVAEIDAGTNLAGTYDFDISWAWAYDGDNVKDTVLGNAAANSTAPTINFECSVLVEQVD